jgi:hypothetical protein
MIFILLDLKGKIKKQTLRGAFQKNILFYSLSTSKKELESTDLE